jgi:signal peptidase II
MDTLPSNADLKSRAELFQRRRMATYGAAAAVFALDRLSKWLVETRVAPWETYAVIPHFFNIIHSRNSGAAFGLLSHAGGPWRTILLVGFSAAALAVLAALLWRPGSGARERAALAIGLALILGGAAGNVYDRVMFGSVTDFLDVYVGEYHWFTFNVADSAITTGAALFLLDMWQTRHRGEPKAESQS